MVLGRAAVRLCVAHVNACRWWVHGVASGEQEEFQLSLWRSSRLGHVMVMVVSCIFATLCATRQYLECGFCDRFSLLLVTNVAPSLAVVVWLMLAHESTAAAWATRVETGVVLCMACGIISASFFCANNVTDGLCRVFAAHYIPPLQVGASGGLALTVDVGATATRG